jgi:hypothetical protein
VEEESWSILLAESEGREGVSGGRSGRGGDEVGEIVSFGEYEGIRLRLLEIEENKGDIYVNICHRE